MNREPPGKLHASQSIEDLLVVFDHNRNQQNWLLSYLDVFVLVVMLVITLLAMTDLTRSSQPEQRNKKIAKKQIKPVKKYSKIKTKQTTLVAAKTPSLKTEAQVSKKPEHPEPSVVNAESSSAQAITNKKVATGQKNSEIKTIQQETAKTILSNPDTNAINKPEIKQPQAMEKKAMVAEQENSAINANQETKKNRILNQPNISELNPQTEKQAIPEPKNPAKEWQNQLKNKLDHFEFVNVKIKEGYAQIEIQDNILFDSAEATLKEHGKALLEKLTTLLNQSAGLIFIEGHTDNQPISTQNFPSNWELGSARATSVLHFLISQQIDNQRLRAVTYADTMPLANNSTEEGRRKNRRVNLLVKIPEL